MPIKINGTNTAANPSITGDDTDTGIVYGSDQIDFSTGGTSKVTLNGSNLVLGNTTAVPVISTNKPSLQVLGTDFPTSTMALGRFADDANGPSLNFVKSRNGTIGSNTVVQDGDELGKIRFSGSDGTDFDNVGAEISAVVESGVGANDTPASLLFKTNSGSTNATTKMTLTSAGNLGIGTTSPSAACEIIDSTSSRSYSLSGATELVVERASDVNLSLITTNTHNSRIRFGDTDDEDAGAIDYDHNVNNLNFFTNAAFVGKIDSAGKLVMGTPTVNTSVAFSLVTPGRIQSDATYSLTTSSAANVHIGSNGLMRRGGVSSLKYKKDIADATWGLADVLKLKPKTFKSNSIGDNGETDDKTYAGFIAEDVHDIGLTNFVEYNDNNEPDSLSYGNMVALMAKAIQELNTKVTTLETKVAALEAA